MEVISMMFKLTNVYSLCITISFELNDVPIYTTNPKEVKCRGDNCVLASSILSKCHLYFKGINVC